MFAVLNYGSYDLWQNYHKVTFDGPNKIIRVNEGVTELDIKSDVYSDWKEWTSTRADNATFQPAIRGIGGDPTVAGEKAGDLYFLINGWKLYVDLTKVKVTGVLFSDDFDTAYYDFNGNAQFPAQVSSIVSGVSATSGATADQVWTYNDRSLTQAVSASAPTTAEIAQAVWEYLTRTLTESSGTSPEEIWSYSTRTLTTTEAPSASATAAAVWNAANTSYNTVGTMGSLLNEVDYVQKQIWVNLDAASNGDGGQATPYDNINDAIDKAETEGIDIINLIGDITLNRNFKNFTLRGIGLPEVNLNGQNVKNSKFQNVRIKGTYQEGSGVIVQESILQNGAYLEGFFENCALGGDLICQDSATVLLKDCASNIPGTARPTISMNAGGTSLLSVRGYNGGLTIKDCNNAADRVTVEMNPGSLTFDSSCTNGIMVARGVGKFVDNTAGASVTNETVNQSITDVVEASVSAVQTTVNTISTDVGTIDGLVRTVDTVVDGIATDLAIVDTNVDTINTNVNTINTNVNTVNTNLNTANANINTIDGKIDVIDTNVDEIETIVRAIDTNSLSSNIAAVQSSVDAIDTNSLSSNIAAVQTSVDAIDTNSLSSNIAAVQNTADAIFANTTSLSTDLATVQASVDAIDVNTDTSTISSNLLALQSSVDAIDTSTLSSNIASTQASLSAQVATVNSTVGLNYQQLINQRDTLSSQTTTINSINSTTTQIYSTQLNQGNTQSAINLRVLELYRLAGLDADNVADITDTSITVGGITISISAPDNNTTRLTRS